MQQDLPKKKNFIGFVYVNLFFLNANMQMYFYEKNALTSGKPYVGIMALDLLIFSIHIERSHCN